MALPKYVKKFYFPNGSSRVQRQINGTTYSLANYTTGYEWNTGSHSFGSNGNYIIRPETLWKLDHPTYLGAQFTLSLYLSSAKWNSFVSLIMQKILAGFTGTFSLASEASIANEEIVIAAASAAYPCRCIMATAYCAINYNSFNSTTLVREIRMEVYVGVGSENFDGSKATSTVGAGTYCCHFQTDGNFRVSAYSSQLESVLQSIYSDYIAKAKVLLSPHMDSSGTTGNFTSRRLSETDVRLLIRGLNVEGYGVGARLSGSGTDVGTYYGSWTQDGTVDPSDPGETPTPPVPPGPPDPPSPPVIPDPDDPITPPGLPDIGGANLGFFSVYNPTDVAMRLVAQSFWSTSILDQIKLYFNNPMETIMGFGIVPVKPDIGASSHIMFGMADSGVSAPVVTSEYKIVNCGSRSLHTYYGSYLDFEPYTEVSMYLPYIGEVEMNPDEMMGREIGVLYYVNVISGDIVAMVTADGTIVYTAASNCFRQLPLSQYDMSQIIHSAIAAVESLGMGLVKAGAAAATAGASGGGAIQSAAGYGASDAEVNSAAFKAGAGTAPSMLNSVMSMKRHYQRSGRIGTGSGQLSYQKPYMIVLRPNLMLPDGAGDVGTNSDLKAYEGYPCNQIVTMSSLHGMTVVEASRLAIPGATANEIDEIMAMLKEGVIF